MTLETNFVPTDAMFNISSVIESREEQINDVYRIMEIDNTT
ncbi:MAG: hypothetical protein ACTHJ7_03865 [Candidatus Nitrosocosmicus sp.]